MHLNWVLILDTLMQHCISAFLAVSPAGRSGRRERPPLAVYVAFEEPLDQYFMKSPQKLFGRPIECCHVDSQNKQVLEQHLMCAAVEHPLNMLYDDKYFGPGLHSAILALTNKGCLSYHPMRDSSTRIWSYIGHEAYPVKDCETQHSRTTSQAHTCKVTTSWVGFFRIERGSGEIIDSVDLTLPQYSYESQAVWIRVSQSIEKEVDTQSYTFRAGLHAASHAVLNVVPLFIQCNSSDMGTECANPQGTRYFPERILLYDQHPGGIGLSGQVQPLFRELLGAVLELVTGGCCSLNVGCPNCLQTLSCHKYNEVLDKSAAIMILKGVIETEDLYFNKRSDSCVSSNSES